MTNLGRIFECFNDEVLLDSLFMPNTGKMYNRHWIFVHPENEILHNLRLDWHYTTEHKNLTTKWRESCEEKYFMKLFMTVNIHLEFQHGDRVFPTQVEKTEELDFLFVSLFERPCVIGRLTVKVARHSIYLFTNFVVSSHTVVVERF